MLYSFDDMPDSSRMWVYQANRTFSDEELLIIDKEAKLFVDSWAAHGKGLRAAFQVEKRQFVLLAVDESYHPATGCSIDDSVGFIRNLEQKLDIQLLDRSSVAFYIDNQVVTHPLKSIKSNIEAGKIQKDTPIFNSFINNLKDFRTTWTQPASESWVGKYFS